MNNTNYLLKGERVAHNKSQLEMAQHLGICETAYTMKERGQRKFTLPESEEIAILFELSLAKYAQIFLPKLFTQTEQKA
jgi:DNA-binding XRE family transcriptional regulator